MGRVAPGAPGIYGPATRPLPASLGPRTRLPSTQTFGPAFTNGLLPYVVVDRFGAVSIPAQPQGDDAALGDPALTYTLLFLYAALVSDGGAAAPWVARFGQPLIKSPLSLFPWGPADPLAGTFNAGYLPCLFLWRSGGGKWEQKADDYLLESSTWTLLWVPPIGGQQNQAQRSTYGNQFAKSVASALDDSRTPSFVMPGDPDPSATLRGSFLWTALNCNMQWISQWKPSRVVIEMADKSASPRPYRAIEIKIGMVEHLHRSIDRHGTRGVGLNLRTLNQYGLNTGQTILP